MNGHNSDKAYEALIQRRDEIHIGIKRAERQLTDYRVEWAETQAAIDDIEREQLKANEL